MTTGEKKLFALLVNYASDVISHRGCCDLTDEMIGCLTDDEWVGINKRYHDWNGDPEEFDPEWLHGLGDFMLLNLFADQLLKVAEEDVCEWKEATEGVLPIAPHPNELTGCSFTTYPIVITEGQFCPDCGKKIKVVENE